MRQGLGTKALRGKVAIEGLADGAMVGALVTEQRFAHGGGGERPLALDDADPGAPRLGPQIGAGPLPQAAPQLEPGGGPRLHRNARAGEQRDWAGAGGNPVDRLAQCGVAEVPVADLLGDGIGAERPGGLGRTLKVLTKTPERVRVHRLGERGRPWECGVRHSVTISEEGLDVPPSGPGLTTRTCNLPAVWVSA